MEGAKRPQYGSVEAAGLDLFSTEAAIIPARGQKLIPTGIICEPPTGTYGRVAPRSGLSLKCRLSVGAGVIDPDYRGQIFVLMRNHNIVDVRLSKHSAIAQLVIEKYCRVGLQIVDNLSVTQRGTQGFGSTDT